MFEEYEVEFTDGTTTVFWVEEDESVQDRAIANAEHCGLGASDIAAIRPTGNVMGDDDDDDA